MQRRTFLAGSLTTLTVGALLPGIAAGATDAGVAAVDEDFLTVLTNANQVQIPLVLGNLQNPADNVRAVARKARRLVSGYVWGKSRTTTTRRCWRRCSGCASSSRRASTRTACTTSATCTRRRTARSRSRTWPWSTGCWTPTTSRPRSRTGRFWRRYCARPGRRSRPVGCTRPTTAGRSRPRWRGPITCSRTAGTPHASTTGSTRVSTRPLTGSTANAPRRTRPR